MVRLLALLGLLLVSGCGSALRTGERPVTTSSAEVVTVQAPRWKVGSQWEYSDGYGLQVAAVDGAVSTFRRLDDPQQWVVRHGFLREDAQSATTLRKLLFEDLPAGEGLVLSSRAPLTYRRQYQAGAVQYTHVTSWTVERRETVKVPAGEFDCVVLVMRTRNLADGWTGFERWWFSPRAQGFVRMEYRYGSAPDGSRVLTRYRLADGGPTSLSP